MILAVQTTTFSKYGGIPTYNRLVCRVLNQISDGKDCHVLIATDKESDIEKPSIEFPQVRLQAFNHNRRALILEFIRLVLTRQVDLVLLGHVNYAPLGWLLRKLRPKLRYGVMLYGVDVWRRLPLLKRRALLRADFLVSISDYTKQRAVEANALNSESIYLLPNALESIAGEPSPATIRTPARDGTRLLSVCRLEETERYKGVDKVIEVLAQVASKVPDIQYLVVGGGTDLERHKMLAQKLGVANRVHFLGFLSNEDLLACYQNCDVFVMPSAGEGFGFVFLEAMRYAKPIVAAESGGAPEVIQDGATGRLVEYGNQEQLTQALVDLCLDPAERTLMGEAGYRRLQNKFTFRHFRDNLSAILQQEMRPRVPMDAVSSTNERTAQTS